MGSKEHRRRQYHGIHTIQQQLSDQSVSFQFIVVIL